MIIIFDKINNLTVEWTPILQYIIIRIYNLTRSQENWIFEIVLFTTTRYTEKHNTLSF